MHFPGKNMWVYEKRDDFSLNVTFPFLDVDVPLAPSHDVYVFHLVGSERICNNISVLDNDNRE